MPPGWESLGHEEPHSSSTTSCQGDTPLNGSWPGRGAWQLLLLCSSGLVKFHGPLLGLQAAMANMASHCLSVYLLSLGLLWCSSLQLGAGLTLTLTLAQELCMEVLLPVQQALRQPLTITWPWGLQLLAILIRGAWHSFLPLLWCLWWEALLTLLPVVQWAYYSLVNTPHKNSKALELLLWAVLQQLAVSLQVHCLHRVWLAVGQVAWARSGSGLRPLE